MINALTNVAKPNPTGRYTVTLIPGDGIGGEVAESVKAIFKAGDVPVDWEQINTSGICAGQQDSHEQLRASIESLKRNKVRLKGTFYTPVELASNQSLNVVLRQQLDLYAAIIPIKNIPDLETRHHNVDFVIIRENIEGEYCGHEHQCISGVVESLKIVTRRQSERVVKFAFEFAQAQKRKKVTCIHKANILKLSDGLFRDSFLKCADRYPALAANNMIIDNATMQAVVRPQQFDVVVLPNLYGIIMSNIGAALVGGAGVVPSCTFGDEVAVFEPGCRHVGLGLQACILLKHLGLDGYADKISAAVYNVIKERHTLTRDLGGHSSTQEFTSAIINKMN